MPTAVSGGGRPSLADIRDKRQQILAAARRHGMGEVRVFGSVARAEADERSDLDLLVDAQPGRSLMDLGAFALDVEDLVGRRVDVTTVAGLKPRIRDRVLGEAIPL